MSRRPTPQGRALREREVLCFLRAACAEAGSQKLWAESVGVSGAYVSDVLLGRRAPGASILDALGVERETVYRQRARA